MSPLVSVVMPVYNVEAYVAEAIKSVLAQTFGDFELILVDDGGTDRSVEICRYFDDPRLQMISQANATLASPRRAANILAFLILMTAGCRKNWRSMSSTWKITRPLV